jgi:GNAT superfamily N-acetyltransferase
MGIGIVTGTPDEATCSTVVDTGPPPAAGPANGAARVCVITLTGGLANLMVSGLGPVLAEVALLAFTAPPWNETPAQAWQLADRMLADAQRPGFALALAFTGGGMRLVGFGYGLPRCPAPGSPIGPLPFAPFAGTEPFEFCELAVMPAARGIGVGRALHDAVLAASNPQPRWLVTHPAAHPAVRLYQTSGWQISRVFPSSTNGSSRLLMTRYR